MARDAFFLLSQRNREIASDNHADTENADFGAADKSLRDFAINS
jgi:hypothetical protein